MMKIRTRKIASLAFAAFLTLGILGCGGGGGGTASSPLNWSIVQKPINWSSASLQGSLTQVGGDRQALLVPPLAPDVSNAKLWIISPSEKSLRVLTLNAITESTVSATGRQYDLSSNFGSASTLVNLQGAINTNTNPASLSLSNSTVFSFESNLELAALQQNLRGTWAGIATGELGHEITLSIDEAGIVTSGNSTQGHAFTGQILARTDIRTYQVDMRGTRQNQRFSIDGIALIIENNSRMNLMWVLTDLDTGVTSAAAYSLTRQ